MVALFYSWLFLVFDVCVLMVVLLVICLLICWGILWLVCFVINLLDVVFYCL